MGRRIAIVLFNLGGPDKPASVQPFLQNLFKDPAIIRAPGPVRWLLSRLISRTRAPSVKKNYAMMDAGGGSPLLGETHKQAEALERSLSQHLSSDEVRCFIAMRYWHPFTEEAAQAVKEWNADEVVLLPLYPQFSTTTTGSSLTAWQAAFHTPARTVCCYPFDENFVDAHVQRILQAYDGAGKPRDVTLLLSAHGLPEQVVRDGDPYQWQCETLGRMLTARLPPEWEVITCYQSRVGPLKWIGPPTETEVEKAAQAGRNILIAPIAFVSEHIETLVELGEEYREIADASGAASYTRVEALGTAESFIRALTNQTLAALDMPGRLRSCAGGRLCPSGWSGCPHLEMAQPAEPAIAEPAL
jgi:ferrochelatase